MTQLANPDQPNRTKELAAAPASLRLPVARLWVLVKHLFPSPSNLAVAVGFWTKEHDLREEDAAAVLDAMCAPAVVSKFKFASDVITELAGRCAEATRRWKAAEAERRRAESRKLEDEATKAGATKDANAVRDLLAAWRERNGGK